MYECDYDTYESDYDTHTCQIHTLRVEITIECDAHTHPVMNTHKINKPMARQSVRENSRIVD
jgi:hypothetical protein